MWGLQSHESVCLYHYLKVPWHFYLMISTNGVVWIELLHESSYLPQALWHWHSLQHHWHIKLISFQAYQGAVSLSNESFLPVISSPAHEPTAQTKRVWWCKGRYQYTRLACYIITVQCPILVESDRDDYHKCPGSDEFTKMAIIYVRLTMSSTS